MTTDHVYFPEPNSGRCVANGDEPLCTLSADQHQPAAAAPGLSEDIEAIEIEGEIRERHQPIQHLGGSCPTGTCCRCLPGVACDAGTLIKFLDATRADLARTRAERDALRAAMESVLALENEWGPRWRDRAYQQTWTWDKTTEIIRSALAASHSEPQPAAPVAPRGVACPKCGGDAFASFDVIVGRGCGHVIGATTPPVAPSAEGSDPPWIRRGFSATVHGRSWPYVTCLDCGWLTYTDSPTVVHHMADCPHAATPPDHQAGDEP